MTNVICSQKQDSVQVCEVEGMVYVYIYLNEAKQTEKNYFDDSETTVYTYDYNELKFKKGDADIEKIKANPENYMNISEITSDSDDYVGAPTIEERVSVIEELLLADLGGEK